MKTDVITGVTFSKGSDHSQTIEEIRSKTHPELTQPVKIIWETRSKVNKIVTFYHDEHTDLFRIKCNNCHNQESCIKCHSNEVPGDYSKPISIDKSSDRHHKPCSNCHYGYRCEKCHLDGELQRFNHSKSTGWSLNGFHSGLECSNCHGGRMQFRKLDRAVFHAMRILQRPSIIR